MPYKEKESLVVMVYFMSRSALEGIITHVLAYTLKMPVISFPFPNCHYSSDDVDAVAGAAQLNIHALTHRIVGPTSAKKKSPKIDRTRLSRGTTEE